MERMWVWRMVVGEGDGVALEAAFKTSFSSALLPGLATLPALAPATIPAKHAKVRWRLLFRHSERWENGEGCGGRGGAG